MPQNIDFFRLVYNIVQQIPAGRVATYGQIAKILGYPNHSRIVGWALHANPSPGTIPCHRVVNRKGELSGSFAFGGSESQQLLLANEGIEVKIDGKVNMGEYLRIPEDSIYFQNL